MVDPVKNFAYGTIATAPSPATSGTSFVIGSGLGALFPAPATEGAFNLVIWPAGVQPLSSNAEIVRCTARSTDTFTIVRTQESTSARTIIVGDQVALTLTAKIIPDLSGSIWTPFLAAYASATTITVTGSDVTSIFKKGVSLMWYASDGTTVKIAKVVSSSFSTDTTITIVGSASASGDKWFMRGPTVMSETFIIPGNQSTGTNVSKTWTNKFPIFEISVDAIVSTAGTTNSTDYDLNIGGSTKITTKPSIASTATTDLDNVVDNPATEVAVNSLHTIDIDAASTTQAIDGYLTLFYIPSWWINRT